MPGQADGAIKGRGTLQLSPVPKPRTKCSPNVQPTNSRSKSTKSSVCERLHARTHAHRATIWNIMGNNLKVLKVAVSLLLVLALLLQPCATARPLTETPTIDGSRRLHLPLRGSLLRGPESAAFSGGDDDTAPLRFTNGVDVDQVTGEVFFTDNSMNYQRS
ncbi:hypothetical protein HU200_035705 [Digitaria exilis]|uniref:Uncharacterized protein n=1 Tax=Digitaria exilis TaxID=1010633 RepID=A0A835EJ46_9POAL|nr:hypothetical protein HU200_035705 [Digitaria exilis]